MGSDNSMAPNSHTNDNSGLWSYRLRIFGPIELIAGQLLHQQCGFKQYIPWNMHNVLLCFTFAVVVS